MKEKNNLMGVFEPEEHDKIYVIGDVHGDYACFIHCLVDLCEVCNITEIENIYNENKEYLEWKLNNTSTVIFCGDLMDRKRFDHVLDDECSDVYILKTLLRLKKEAIQNGGNVIIISGNHEMMNITTPDYTLYVSDKNKIINFETMTNVEFINEYIKNSYAWVVINDILLCHGGLCSDYLNYLNKIHPNIKGIEIVNYINKAYKIFFTNFNYKNIDVNGEYYELFIKQQEKESEQNIFWCRMWGYNSHTQELFNKTVQKIGCNKMIVAHCPQFLDKTEPKMINFEYENNGKYNLARIDLGMSRSFDYNKEDKFMYYLEYHFNRKMSVLKLNIKNGEAYFDLKSIITKKLSCIQYLLLKYGIKKEDWLNYNIDSNWLGFEKIKNIVLNKCIPTENNHNETTILEGLIYPVYCSDLKNSLFSIQQFKNVFEKQKKPKTICDNSLLQIKNAYKYYNEFDLNTELIHKNAIKLTKEYKKLYDSYENIKNINPIFIEESNEYVKSMVNSVFFKDYPKIQDYLNTHHTVLKTTYENITLYCVKDTLIDENTLKYMCTENVITAYLFCLLHNKKQDVIIIWLPINITRHFEYSEINKKTIKQSQLEFKAFSASGCTFNNISIITRVAENQKLLLHELIHNLNLDGSKMHNHFHDELQVYDKIKSDKNHKYSLDIYESYTELLSLYYNILMTFLHEHMEYEEETILKKITSFIIMEYFYSLNLIVNIIKLNGYKSYEEFLENDIVFEGEICVYEYYYLKTLMINNYELEDLKVIPDFKNNLRNIINLKLEDKNLKFLFNKEIPTNNFKYVFLDGKLVYKKTIN